MLLAANDPVKSYRGSNGLYWLSELADPGPYLGIRNNPKAFSERVSKYGKVPRTVLFRGPTGVGKSVFARHVAKHLSKEDSKVLKIASSVLKKCQYDNIVQMVQYFQPTILLLDDLALNDPELTEGFLSLLEALRHPECLVIVTMMTDYADSPKKALKMGEWHFSGMRPGRIDEILTFFLPNKRERDMILRNYLEISEGRICEPWEDILGMTKGLSGAYLGEVARRLTVHGFDSYKEEIQNVLRAAPEVEVHSNSKKSKKKKGKKSSKGKQSLSGTNPGFAYKKNLIDTARKLKC